MTTDLHIRPVTDSAARRQFLDLPAQLYHQDPNWVPALRSADAKIFAQKTAFFHHADMALFLAHRGSRPVGRIAAIHNHAHNKHYHDAVGFFGFFDCDPADQPAAHALLQAAQSWLADRGLKALRGPVNPSMNSTTGLLIEGFHRPPMALMPYNPPAYASLFESFGLAKCKDLFAYLLEHADLAPGTPNSDRLLRLGQALKRRNKSVTIRTINMSRFQEDLLVFMQVFETARRQNWGYVPLTREEILETAHDLRRVIDPEIVLLAEVDGRPAGALLAIPNINRPLASVKGRLFPLGFIRFFRELKHLTEMRILGVAALPEDRTKGITASLFIETLIRGSNRGYRTAEASWVLEDNQMSNASIQGITTPQLYKKYRLYEKPL